jgi:TRIAP1/MDM35 family protein
MNSLSKKCQEAKEKYDACFNNWFSERYLKGNTEDVCEPLFKVYQKCVKEAIEEHKIELWNLPSEYEPSSKKSSGVNEHAKNAKESKK